MDKFSDEELKRENNSWASRIKELRGGGSKLSLSVDDKCKSTMNM